MNQVRPTELLIVDVKRLDISQTSTLHISKILTCYWGYKIPTEFRGEPSTTNPCHNFLHSVEWWIFKQHQVFR